MSFRESALRLVRDCASKLTDEARRIGILRSLDATRSSEWLLAIARELDKACDQSESSEDIEQSAEPAEREIVVAFLRDRAEQYDNKSSCRVSIEDAFVAINKGEHIEAYRHGELDDLLRRPLR